VRVPLMGVVKRLQSTRLASQLAFMLVEHTRREAVPKYGCARGEFGWILDDNQGMRSMAETLEASINKVYRIYEKAL
jgi:transposase-like protein